MTQISDETKEASEIAKDLKGQKTIVILTVQKCKYKSNHNNVIKIV